MHSPLSAMKLQLDVKLTCLGWPGWVRRVSSLTGVPGCRPLTTTSTCWSGWGRAGQTVTLGPALEWPPRNGWNRQRFTVSLAILCSAV